MKTIEKYPKAIIAIHWLTFLLVVFTFYKGTTLEHLDFTEVNMNTFRAHAIPGMIILILTLIRMRIKRKNKNQLPPDIEYYSPLHKMIVEGVTKLLYLLLILAPLAGFIMVYKTGAFQYDIGGAFPEGAEFSETWETLHKIFVFSLVGLIFIHIAGVIIYKIKTGKNLIRRICKLMK